MTHLWFTEVIKLSEKNPLIIPKPNIFAVIHWYLCGTDSWTPIVIKSVDAQVPYTKYSICI
jgi:hypothetical protein